MVSRGTLWSFGEHVQQQTFNFSLNRSKRVLFAVNGVELERQAQRSSAAIFSSPPLVPISAQNLLLSARIYGRHLFLSNSRMTLSYVGKNLPPAIESPAPIVSFTPPAHGFSLFLFFQRILGSGNPENMEKTISAMAERGEVDDALVLLLQVGWMNEWTDRIRVAWEASSVRVCVRLLFVLEPPTQAILRLAVNWRGGFRNRNPTPPHRARPPYLSGAECFCEGYCCPRVMLLLLPSSARRRVSESRDMFTTMLYEATQSGGCRRVRVSFGAELLSYIYIRGAIACGRPSRLTSDLDTSLFLFLAA